MLYAQLPPLLLQRLSMPLQLVGLFAGECMRRCVWTRGCEGVTPAQLRTCAEAGSTVATNLLCMLTLDVRLLINFAALSFFIAWSSLFCYCRRERE